MKTIYLYDDYRKFLADYYAERKTTEKRFSYRILSMEAGFANKGFIFNVIQGKRNLSGSSVFQLSQALKLPKREAQYFENLIFFNQATNYRERQHFFDRMVLSRTNSHVGSQAKRIREDQFELYSKWYNAVIRSVLDLCPFRGDFEWLAKMVRPAITPKQAKKAIQLLEKLGLILKQEDGFYKLSELVLTTGPEVSSLAVQKFHLDMIALAAKAIESMAKTKRNATGLTINLSKESYNAVCQKLLACQEEIMAIVRNDTKADQVFQLCFQLFPVSFPTSKRPNPALSPAEESKGNIQETQDIEEIQDQQDT